MTMKHLCVLAMAFIMLASCESIDYSTVEIGQPYVGRYQDIACVAVFDQVKDDHISGRFYLDDDKSVVEPIRFTTELKPSGKGTLRVEGKEMTLKKVSLKKKQVKGRADNNKFSLSLVGDSDFHFKPLYENRCYEVTKEESRVYANDVEGYWTYYPDTHEKFITIYLNKVSKLKSTEKQKLDMDLYYPKDTTNRLRPLLLLIHGGAFYNGDKKAVGYPEMGQHFAERGYVVASINYRLGFLPLADDVDRAGYRALQDAHAAVCYLVENAEEFGIDTTKIFAAGTSAGAITALNLAFMDDDSRPESTREGGVNGMVSSKAKKLFNVIDDGISYVGSLFDKDWGIDVDVLCKKLGLDSDLGPINSVAGSTDRPFQIKAVVNMWGAVHDLAMLKNSPSTSILSFHGDKDPIVPYSYGYPFDKVLDPYVDDIFKKLPDFTQPIVKLAKKWVSDGKPINEWAFNPMQGSKAIHDKISSMPNWQGRNELHTLKGADSHSLHVNGASLNKYFYDTIMPVMTRFLCEEMVGGEAVRLEQDGLWYEVSKDDNVAELHWQVEGGVVLEEQGENKVKVLFFGDTPCHSVAACGRYRNGVEFREICLTK